MAVLPTRTTSTIRPGSAHSRSASSFSPSMMARCRRSALPFIAEAMRLITSSPKTIWGLVIPSAARHCPLSMSTR